MIYEVTVCIAPNREQEWLAWIAPHINDILATGCFTSAHVELVTEEAQTTPCYVVRYHCNSKADYQRYVDEFAEFFRNDGVMRFGTDMSASRRILVSVIHAPSTSR